MGNMETKQTVWEELSKTFSLLMQGSIIKS